MVVPTIIALSVTTVSVFLFSWINYRSNLNQIRTELASKSTTAIRRITAELLLGSRGAPYVVADNLRSELGVGEIRVSKTDSACVPSSSQQPCEVTNSSTLSLTGLAGSDANSAYVTVTSAVPSFKASIPLGTLAWSTLPLLIVFGLGIIFQQRQLRRFFLSPIESITAKTVAGSDIPDHWPKEFVRLHSELDNAFQKRDEAIIGQIASGVIHDLKTLLQPISGACQLASESNDEDKLGRKMEMLLKSCQRNLPKMQRILEDVLDGNREIRLQSRTEPLAETIRSALSVAKEAADCAEQVTVEFLDNGITGSVNHDSIQLERAITNLIKNGIEAAAGSEALRMVRVQLALTDESTVISIEDSGPGLNASLDHILATRKTSKRRGTGLGLLVTKKIIEAHKGTLEGGTAKTLSGARFEVVLPGGVA
jgi:signal transduction histidine kinase